MEREQFEATVRRLETYSAQNPAGYRRRVALLALVGYVPMVASLLGAAALAVAIVAILVLAKGRGAVLMVKGSIPLIVAAVVMARAMVVHLPRPTGRVLQRHEAPELFKLLEHLRQTLRTKRIHQVLITDEFNAAMVEVPRFGLFGGTRTYLILGLPLMQGLSPQQFMAVLVHELGHLSGRDGRMSGWIYRVRAMWMKLQEQMEHKRTLGTALLRRFYKWYAPYFSAYSFVLARSQERLADRVAVDLAGATHACDAITRCCVIGRLLSRVYWPELERRVRLEAQPPHPFDEIRSLVREGVPAQRATAWLAEELNRATDAVDTHPSLRDRLSAMGRPPHAAMAVQQVGALTGQTAADAYLGAFADQLTAQFDAQWRAAVQETWQAQHVAHGEMENRLAELHELREAGKLKPSEWVELALITVKLEPPEVAQPLLEQALQVAPDDAHVHFQFGQLLLEQSDERGLHHLERAMELDPTSTMPACSIAIDFLDRTGRTEERKRFLARGDKALEQLEAAHRESSQLSTKDELRPHQLGPEIVGKIVDAISQHSAIRRAYLVEKPIAAMPGLKQSFLVVDYRPPAWKLQTENSTNKMIRALSQTLDGIEDLVLFVLDHQQRKFIKHVAKVEGSMIYDRRQWRRAQRKTAKAARRQSAEQQRTSPMLEHAGHSERQQAG